MSADLVDYLKFAAALIVLAQGEFRALHNSGSPAAEPALARLRHLHAELTDAAGRFCPDGENAQVWAGRYSDGRPVISAMPMDVGLYIHAWHPDHAMNNPCTMEYITPDGARKQILVVAEGFLDSFTETVEASGQPTLAQTE